MASRPPSPTPSASSSGLEMDIFPPPPKKAKKSRKVKTRGVTCIPTVIEIKKSSASLPNSSPQIVLDDGWTIYFGDEVGIKSNSPTHFHIKNSLDGSMGVSLKIDLFT